MRRGLVLLLSISAMISVAACSGGGVRSAASGPSEASVTTSSTTPLDRSPFCVAIRGLETLGTESSAGPATTADVLDANTRLARLIEQVAAGIPAGAPADVQSLVADYRVLTKAIADAQGDTTAAFAAIEASSPQVAARLGEAGAHRDAFSYFASRCGTAPPT